MLCLLCGSSHQVFLAMCHFKPSPHKSQLTGLLTRYLTADVDFCISLGGDGTVLHLTSLFVEDTPLPPVISFSMGTLGFLTPFDAGEFEPCLGRVLAANQDPVFCTLRTRKRCEVYW